MRYKLCSVALLSIVLAGCVIQDKTLTVDGAPPQPNSKVARLVLHDWYPFSGMRYEHVWDLTITSVDGRPVALADRDVQLGLGKHKFTYTCDGKVSTYQWQPLTGKGAMYVTITPAALGTEVFPTARNVWNRYASHFVSPTHFVAYGHCTFSGLTFKNPTFANL